MVASARWVTGVVLCAVALGCGGEAPDTVRTTVYGGGQLELTFTGTIPLQLSAPGIGRSQVDALDHGVVGSSWTAPWVVLGVYPDRGGSTFLAADVVPAAGPYGPGEVRWEADRLSVFVEIPPNQIAAMGGERVVRAEIVAPAPTGPAHHVTAPVEWYVFDGAGTRVVGTGQVDVRLALDPGMTRTWDAKILRCTFC